MINIWSSIEMCALANQGNWPPPYWIKPTFGTSIFYGHLRLACHQHYNPVRGNTEQGNYAGLPRPHSGPLSGQHHPFPHRGRHLALSINTSPSTTDLRDRCCQVLFIGAWVHSRWRSIPPTHTIFIYLLWYKLDMASKSAAYLMRL